MEKIHRIAKINANEHQIYLTCNWPVAQWRFTVVPISDDDDTRAILELHPGVNSIEIYMEKDNVSYQMHREFTHMLDLDNESTCFMSSMHNT